MGKTHIRVLKALPCVTPWGKSLCAMYWNCGKMMSRVVETGQRLRLSTSGMKVPRRSIWASTPCTLGYRIE